MKDIAILLPYKENFSSSYAGAVSIFVDSTNKLSKFKKDITVFGSTNFKNKLSKNYVNINLTKKLFTSQSKEYVQKFFDIQSKINSDIESTKSRVKVLENIEATYGWLPEGIRNFVHQLKGKSVDGTVSDFIKSRTGYEKAIESALGEKLKWILINDKKNTIDTIEKFKSTCTGRGTFIPINNRIQAGGSLDINQTMIMDCIECDQENRQIHASILGDT